MRPINFRGQDKANKKWVYGNLEIPLIIQNISRHYIIGWAYGQYQKHEVYPETVCQYTGLKDKNGKGIYEGDIWKENHSIAIVTYEGDRFKLDWKLDRDFFSDTLCRHAEYGEVIGNIYENPDLLEAK